MKFWSCFWKFEKKNHHRSQLSSIWVAAFDYLFRQWHFFVELFFVTRLVFSPLVSNWIENLRYTAPGTLERFLVLKEFIRNIKASKDTNIYNIMTDAGFVEKTLLETIASSDNSLERDLGGIILSRITCHEFAGRVNCHKVGGVVILLDGLQLDHEELCRRNYLIILANVVQLRPAAKECMHLSGCERLS